ncbi:MAG: NADH-quinone oxidoreductase subunit NuoF [Planctomycetes bacterium]|nr:NADH-quinone oxidoreductase subunit NuoF [Planctomycetota bacterium]
MIRETRVMLEFADDPAQKTLEGYRRNGGYEAFARALKEMSPDQVTEEVLKSGLRGRGGAGFPCGRKWQFVPKGKEKPKYICVNADESEPGTCKDRQIMERDPHQMLEGTLLAAYAIGAQTAYIYIRGEYPHSIRATEEAIKEARAAGLIGKNILGSGFDCDVWVHPGAGAYICGEETALLTSLEGNRGYPRIKPPFPAVEGLWRSPTIVNNVETLACVTHILRRGADWFRGLGCEGSTGTRLFCLSGHVKHPGVYELECGKFTLRELLTDLGGGTLSGRPIKGVMPGGSSFPVLTADELDVRFDVESVAKTGSSLGSGAIMVFDDSVSAVDVALNIAEFYSHESCGQCTPCREGSDWVRQMLRLFQQREAKAGDLETLWDVTTKMDGTTICALAEALVWPVQSYVKKFRAEFEAAASVRGGGMSATVNVTIDGQSVAVPAGLNLIEAAAHVGKSVPHYCYHPRLSVVGNCRICLCEVEGMGKLQIGCNTTVREGMAFHTENERVRGARSGVMELLLINHPLDCPICDQAGECKLQDYAVDHGSGVTRFEFEKARKPKNVSWGDKVVFDSERCILCTRCVRFLDEVAETDEVGIDLRGGKATLIVKGDGHLTSPYQMNVIDLCPVGALTSKDFRFKSRVWFMKFTDTVCTSCARGCNVTAGARDDRLMRMVPRANAQVNDHWMCDEGRLHYAFVNDAERITSPRVGATARLSPAIARAAHHLEGRARPASPSCSSPRPS